MGKLTDTEWLEQRAEMADIIAAAQGRVIASLADARAAGDLLDKAYRKDRELVAEWNRELSMVLVSCDNPQCSDHGDG